MNAQLLRENSYLKEENFGLTKEIEAKESMLTEELENLVMAQKELETSKLMLEKFNTNSRKLDKILTLKREI